MAKKTMILRPTGFYGTNNIGLTPYPSETSVENYHLLISEESADEDATYVITTDNMPMWGFLFSTENTAITPIAIRFVARARSSYNTSNMAFCYFISSKSAINSGDNILLTTQYENYIFVIPEEHLLDAWQELCYSSQTHFMNFKVTNSNNNNNKGGEADCIITQLYIEIDYDDEAFASDIVYIKENGLWTGISGTIYKKENNAWLVADSTVFNNGDRFNFQKITS